MIKREELAKRLVDTKAAIEKLENSEEVFLYATKEKYLPKIGHVHEIDSFEGLLKAQNIVNQSKEQVYTEAAAQLGLTEAEMPVKENLLMGMKTSYWDKDLQTRRDEIRFEIRLKNLKRDAEILKRNLGAEDKFQMEMLELSGETL
jgi:hypothetical protein